MTIVVVSTPLRAARCGLDVFFVAATHFVLDEFVDVVADGLEQDALAEPALAGVERIVSIDLLVCDQLVASDP